MRGSIKQISLVILSGVIGVGISQLVYCLGLSKSESASMTAPWMLVTPILVLILGLILKYDNFTWQKVLGIVIALSGCAGMIVVNRNTTYYYLFLHTLCLAIGIIMWRKLLKDYNNSPTVVALWALAAGTVVILIAYIFLPVWLKKKHFLHDNLEGLKHIIGCWFMVTIAYSCNYAILAWATKKSSITVVAIYASARPVLTTIISLLNEENDSNQKIVLSIVFLLMVLFGLLVVSYGKKVERYKKTKKEEERSVNTHRMTFRSIIENTDILPDRAPAYKKLEN